MVESVHYTQTSELLCAFSGKTRIIVQWLISPEVQALLNSRECGWELVISGKGSSMHMSSKKNKVVSLK